MVTTEPKRQELLQLARHRQADRLPPHHCLADFHNAYYECDHVSPWSISACNVNAELMIIGQDWASSDILEREPDEVRRSIGQDWSSSTNTNLRRFLEHMTLEFSDTYATNIFPFIKKGSKSAPIPFRDLVRCARTYALPQIEIVSPRMAICLGKRTFDAIRRASGLNRLDWSEARSPGLPNTRLGSVEIYGMPHPSPLGIINAGGEDAVDRGWRLLAEHFDNMREQGIDKADVE
jgi:uracil-DNA glycosylase